VLLGHALGPWRRTAASPDEDRYRVAELVARRGTDTLAPFALRTDNTYFFDASREAVLAYRVVAGVALVSGSPIGATDRAPSLIRDFLAYTRHRGWTAAAIGLSDDGLAVWRAHGFDGHYTGDEAIVQPALFTLDGRAVRKVRQSVSRLTSRGYRTLVVSGRSIDDDLAERLAGIADRWRGPARETGFSMAFESAAVCRERDDVYVLALDGAGDVRGFLHLASVPAGAALSLSSMRRDRDTPNGLNEFLICSLLDWAREHGVERVSLNFSAFAAVLQARGPIDHVTAFEQRVLRALSGRFQLERLHAFSAKFATSWEPRYAAYPGVRAVPRVALAAMLAEAYLAPPRLTKRRR
jgi:lysyl-tRNA synthetase class 2